MIALPVHNVSKRPQKSFKNQNTDLLQEWKIKRIKRLLMSWEVVE